LLLPLNSYALEIALSFDDAPRPDGAIFTGGARTQQLIDILNEKNVTEVAIFANTRDFTVEDQARLEKYATAGHIIANHTAHHFNLHDENITPEIFIADIDEADKKLSQLKTYHRWFRYPYLRQARTINDENDMQIQNHLMREKYKHGYVTVETYDWHLDHLMSEDIKNGVPINFKKLREIYIDILWDGIVFYDNLAQEMLGRSPKHILLLHENDLNALFIGDIIDHVRKNGGKIISVSEAYADSIALEKYDTLRLSQRRLRAIAKDLHYTDATSSQFEEQENIEKFYKIKMNN
jgi:peptidoglycan/xylan/chitin deacetylase (PgdA/CDA1 family)